MSEQPQTVQILIALLPSNKIALQVSIDGKILSHIELDRGGATAISSQLADLARKLENTQ